MHPRFVTVRRENLQLAQAGNLGSVRLTMFWELMRAQFGDVYAESVAKDYVPVEPWRTLREQGACRWRGPEGRLARGL